MQPRRILVENGELKILGYEDGATASGISGDLPNQLNRLMLFSSELRSVLRWLDLRTPASSNRSPDENDIATALADAALICFLRCYDYEHPLHPLKVKEVLPNYRSELERLRNIRHQKVAHERLHTTGTYSLLVLRPDFTAIEAVTLQLSAPFEALAPDVTLLRKLADASLAWVTQRYEEIATEVVRAHNALPENERRSVGFAINIGSPVDHFAKR
jgi:hypothetical protein